jgi:hypothetical protein
MGEVVHLHPVARFQLRGWAGGYHILDRGEVICTFHGPRIDLAWKTLCRLRDDVREAQDVVRSMLAASVEDLGSR